MPDRGGRDGDRFHGCRSGRRADPAHHEQAVEVVAKITKRPPARFESWLFTKRDYYRNPDGLPNLKALQTNVEIQKALGLLIASINVE